MDERSSTILEIQLGFFPNSIIERPDTLSNEINTAFGTLFNSVPIIIPLPTDPNLDEVPIVQLKSSNSIYHCKIARKRIDLYIQTDGIQTYQDLQEDFNNKKRIFINFLYEKGYRSKRIAFIIRQFVKDDNNSSSISNLIKPQYIELINGDSYFSSINYTSEININDITVNNYSLIESARVNIVNVGTNLDGILITRDLNTKADEDHSREINAGFIDSLIHEAEQNFHINEISNLLCPGV